MNAQNNNLTNETQYSNNNDNQDQSICDEKIAYAETLLDKVEQAQNQVQQLSDNIALLQTLENALDLIGENLAKIRRMAKLKEEGRLNQSELSALEDNMSNLLMVNMLILEHTEFNGHALFKDSILEFDSNDSGKLYLLTSRIPEIIGIENNDFPAVFDSLKLAANTINRQYKRIGTAMDVLADDYRQIRDQIDRMLTAKAHLQ